MWISLDEDDSQPLSRRIYRRIRKQILDGDLKAGDRIPSSRTLSGQLGVSRNTVLEAYDQLSAEGFLETRHGSGTVVAPGIATETVHPEPDRTDETPEPHRHRKIISFRSGIPALDAFPQKEWARTYQRVCSTLPASAFRYCGPEGVAGLREAIARYLFRTRGIRCPPRRIMITSGATQGLSLAARILYRNGARALVEDPVHKGLVEVLSRAGYDVAGIRTDDDGMDTSRLDGTDSPALIYTTPSHQYPLGGILPIQRRQALIRFARATECRVIEDDYDSEFRFEGSPVGSLYELDPERVIYLGSFSKILAPALRLGFALLPDALTNAWKAEKTCADVHTDALSQHALAAFIDGGELEKHLWKMRKLYKRKRAHLIRALSLRFGGGFTVKGHATGLHMVAAFENVRFSDALTGLLMEKGVKIIPVERHSLARDGSRRHEIILGYAHLSFDAITEGVGILHDVLSSAGEPGKVPRTQDGVPST